MIINKTKFSLKNVYRSVEISFKIEGHKIPINKTNRTKKVAS